MLSWPIIHRLDLPASGLTHAKLLKAFELLRREVSLSVCGSAGAFAGYDRLALLPLSYRNGGRVVATAMLINDTGKTHLVAYDAAVVTNEPRARRHAVALGTGRTVGLAPTRWRATARESTSSR